MRSRKRGIEDMGLGSILGDLIKPVTDIIGKAVVDKDKARELQVRIQELADRTDARLHEELMGQIEVNKVEAAHPSIFVAGWRPAIGWGCGAALLYNTLIAPMFGLDYADLPFLQTVLLGMLGISGLRTYEKVKDVATPGVSMKGVRPQQ